jgi:hypothetical protein
MSTSGTGDESGILPPLAIPFERSRVRARHHSHKQRSRLVAARCLRQ